MKRWMVAFALLMLLAVPASAAEISAPDAPAAAEEYLQNAPGSFQEGILYVLRIAAENLTPQLFGSVKICAALLATAVILSLLKSKEGKSKALVDMAGVISVCCVMVGSTDSLIRTAADTITELCEYGKLLLPAMTAALASQGGGSTAAGLYVATAFFNALLSMLISQILIPAMYIYLVIAMVNATAVDALMTKMKDLLKWGISWGLKLILYAFTGYVTITGVISGTADQTALKAAKITLSGMVPVVGGMLSDASETILVGAALVKNAVGVYGMLVLIALVIGPFLKIGLHYLLLKLTAAVCAIFSDKGIVSLIDDFSSVMGLLLAMTGTVCLLLLISTVCFLKGMG